MVADHLLHRSGQRVEHAVLDPAGADGVDCDTARRQRDREIPAQHLESRFRRTHSDPRLPAPIAAARCVGDGEHASAVGHERERAADADQERFGLRVHRRIPLLEADRHRRLVERADVGARVRHKNVQTAKLAADTVEEPLDLRRPGYVGLDDEPVGAPRPDLLERRLGRAFVTEVVDCDVHALIGEL